MKDFKHVVDLNKYYKKVSFRDFSTIIYVITNPASPPRYTRWSFLAMSIQRAMIKVYPWIQFTRPIQSLFVWSYCNLEQLPLRNSSNMSFFISCCNRSAPGPGINLKSSALEEHRSAPFDLCLHHPPGVTCPFDRPKSSRSILSKTRSPLANFRAKGIPLFTIPLKSLEVR